VRNETYAGTHYYNVHKLLADGRIVVRDRSEWIPISVPAIVDRKTWKRAQHQLNDNAKLRRRPSKRFYLLSGMVQCEDCRRAYVAQADGEGYRVYYHRARDGACRNHQLFATKLEERALCVTMPETTSRVKLEDRAA
jgi:hypothetical protein